MVLLLSAGLNLSCHKTEPFPQNGILSVTLNIQPNQPSYRIPDDFIGISIEMLLVTQGYVDVNNATLVHLFGALGSKGVIRVGAGSVETTYWTGHNRNGSRSTDSLYKDDVDRLFAFARAVGWKVIWGLNLANSKPDIAANEALYIQATGDTTLEAVELGNEPDLYTLSGFRQAGYSETDYESEWISFYNAIHGAAPDLPFIGPGTADDLDWLLPFIKDEAPQLRGISNHYYKMGPPGADGVTISHLLATDGKFDGQVSQIVSACRNTGLTLRMEECNTVFGGGTPGLSNALASSLWGLDFLFGLAQLNAGGVNFHMVPNNYYTPIFDQNKVPVAKPLYYGMLMFAMGSHGRMIPLQLQKQNALLNITAYAVLQDDGRVNAVIINKDPSNVALVTINTGLKTNIQEVTGVELSAPTLESTSSVTLGEDSVGQDGLLHNIHPEIIPFAQKKVTLAVPRSSAMLVQIQ